MRAGLEIRCRSNPTGGSNPSLSANLGCVVAGRAQFELCRRKHFGSKTSPRAGDLGPLRFSRSNERAGPVFEPEGRGFEALPARHVFRRVTGLRSADLLCGAWGLPHGFLRRFADLDRIHADAPDGTARHRSHVSLDRASRWPSGTSARGSTRRRRWSSCATASARTSGPPPRRWDFSSAHTRARRKV